MTILNDTDIPNYDYYRIISIDTTRVSFTRDVAVSCCMCNSIVNGACEIAIFSQQWSYLLYCRCNNMK